MNMNIDLKDDIAKPLCYYRKHVLGILAVELADISKVEKL